VHPVLGLLASVDADLRSLSQTPAHGLSVDEKREAILLAEQVRCRMAALSTDLLAAGDADDVGRDDASPSTGAWLANATKATRKVAFGEVRLAKALDERWPRVRDALRDAVVNPEQARVIVKVLDKLPDGVDEETRVRAEVTLVEMAASHDADELAGFGKYLRHVLDPDEADRRLGELLAAEEEQARKKTWLRMRDNGDGTVSGRFTIPALSALQLTTALEAYTAPRRVGPDGRIAEDGSRLRRDELLGTGLCEYIARYPVGRLPHAGGMSATVVVTMTLEQLLGGGGTARVLGGTLPVSAASGAVGPDGELLISAGEARRLACQAGVVPQVLGSDSEVLDQGRKVRLHTPPQRLAVRTRDKRCRTEGCDRPATWCHAHHATKAWVHGGTTTVKDGIALCPWHHGKAHDPRYEMTITPTRRVRFTRRP